MKCVVFASVIVLGVAVLPLSGAAEEARHSGVVLQTADDRLVLREMVTWTGPGTGIVDRPLTVTSETAVQLVRRAPKADDPRARPGWMAVDLRPDDIRAGDFATVTTREGADGDVAVSIQIVRPEG